MKTANIFMEHPRQVRMTYLQHTRFALMLSRRTLACAAASLVHAFFPFLFTNHTSTTIRELNEIFETRRRGMLQWRHSGLVNAATRMKDGIRKEKLSLQTDNETLSALSCRLPAKTYSRCITSCLPGKRKKNF